MLLFSFIISSGIIGGNSNELVLGNNSAKALVEFAPKI
jgi:hypothetical protein